MGNILSPNLNTEAKCVLWTEVVLQSTTEKGACGSLRALLLLIDQQQQEEVGPRKNRRDLEALRDAE